MIVSPEDAVAVAVVDAIRSGAVATVKELLRGHPGLGAARIGDTTCSRSLLHVATDWPGHFPQVASTVAVLVAAGADPDARFVGTSHAETPLHWAASSNDVEAIDALLAAGADINPAGGVMAGGPPLEDARIFAQWRAAHRLVARGAVTALDDEAALGLVDRLARRFQDPATSPPQADVDRGLWYACHGGQQPAAELLLGAGADLNWIATWERMTPLDAAVRSDEHNNTHAGALIEWLRAQGAHTATGR
ncbi:MAG: ankyrin repeat domain-containing protein [Propionibacteriales bacterium]|nr:ankyrin repeat domain-containing protein [Propionibacteriales bacterium]